MDDLKFLKRDLEIGTGCKIWIGHVSLQLKVQLKKIGSGEKV